MKKLKLTLKAIRVTTVVTLMDLIYFLCPWYVAWCYTKAYQARSIIYSFIFHNYNRLNITLSKHSSYTFQDTSLRKINTYRNEDNIYFIVDDTTDIPLYYSYQGPVSKLKYLWYYYTIWIWLDDDLNVNGLSELLFKDTNKKFKSSYVKYFLDHSTKYKSVFQFEYIKSNKILNFDKIVLIVSKQRTSNYIRVNGADGNYGSILGTGYEYHDYLKKYTIKFLGLDILKNREGLKTW